jgi:hypothetical protein
MLNVSSKSDANDPDAVIDFYKQGVDRTLIRQNLRKSPEDRIRALEALQRFAVEVRRAGAAVRQELK